MFYYVLVLNKFGEKLGYIKVSSKQYVGNFRDYFHNAALEISARYYDYGSVGVSVITKKPNKKLKIINNERM